MNFSLPLLELGNAQRWDLSLIVLLIKATLILVAALGITFAMQRSSAGARHLVWLVTIAGLVLIPALTAWAPLRVEILPARWGASNAAPPAAQRAERDLVIATDAATITMAAGSASVDAAESGAPVANGKSDFVGSLRGAGAWSILLGVWATVALGILASLIWSAFAVQRIVRRARPLDDRSWVTPLLEVSDRLGLSEPPRLLMSNDAKMPFACGLLTPTIVLPAECASWSHERRLAVLLHELAHVRRHDLVGHTLGRLACAFYWFHPLVWTAARRLRSESERACDDLALACGTRATDYAEHLLDIVTSVRREGTPIVALAMARRKEFEGRMLAILDPELRHSTPTRRQSGALIGTLALVSITIGAASPAPRSAESSAARVAIAERAEAVTRSSPPASGDASIAATLGARTSAAPRASVDGNPLDSANAIANARANASANANANASPNPIASATNRSSGVVSVGTDAQAATRTETRTEQSTIASTSRALDAIKGASGSQSRDDRAMLLANVLRTDSNPALRRVAAWGLGEFADLSVAAEALASALRRDSDEKVREMAAWALGQGEERTVSTDALHAALRADASVAVRRTAAWALGSVGDRRSVDFLVGALSDGDASVRSRAVWALGNVEPKSAPPQLLALLGDKDPRVRGLTAWALYNIEDPASAPALQAALRTETDKELQLSYIRALAAMGEKSVDAIRGLLESPDPRIKSMAVHALAGGRAAGPWPHPWPEPRPFP